MTFRQQVGGRGRWGVMALLVAFPIGPVTFGKLWPSPGAAARGIMDGILTASAAFARITLVAGTGMRAAHRWPWFDTFGDRRRAAILTEPAAPFWRWWLHVDGEGRDQDARP